MKTEKANNALKLDVQTAGTVYTVLKANGIPILNVGLNNHYLGESLCSIYKEGKKRYDLKIKGVMHNGRNQNN